MTPLELIETRIELHTVLRNFYEFASENWRVHNNILDELKFIKRALK